MHPVYNTFNDLRLSVGTDNAVVLVLGRDSVGDEDGGFFYWDATSTLPDNGVDVLQRVGNVGPGRWILLKIVALEADVIYEHREEIQDGDWILYKTPDGSQYYITYEELLQKWGGITSGFIGTLYIADTPTEDGIYIAGESGEYVNAGNIEVNLNNGITLIVKNGDSYDDIVIPVDLERYLQVTDLPSLHKPNHLDYNIRILTANGEIENLTSYSATREFVKIDPSKMLFVSRGPGSGGSVNFYDENQSFISNISIGTESVGSVMPPSGSMYVRMIISNSLATRAEDVAAWGMYQPGYFRYESNLVVTTTESENLYDPANTYDNHFVTSSGILDGGATDPNNMALGFLELGPSETNISWRRESTTNVLGAFYDEDMVFISGVTGTSGEASGTTPIPSGAAVFLFNVSNNPDRRVEEKKNYTIVYGTTVPDFIPVKQVTEVGGRPILMGSGGVNASRTVELQLERGGINSSGGVNQTYSGKAYLRTSKYVDVSGASQVSITVSSPCEYRAAIYDADFQFLRQTDFDSTSANSITLNSEEKYVKLTFRKDAPLSDLERLTVFMSGIYADKYEVFNPRPSSGYQALTVHVNVIDPKSTDDTTNDVQDSENMLPDYGLLALPETYSHEGEPTRLIIYCHGAGVNYTPNLTNFPSTDLRPEYWLSEGYAVMDIEGNPFNNVDEHFYIPQAIQCYIAAYEWCMRNYNLKRDGIFLGGRSMGGGMVFEVLQSRIPIISACSLVPVANTLLIWNYCNAQRRSFLAEHLGFTGDAPTWTNSNPMTLAEWDFIKDNWDRMVKYSPMWRGIVDLPDADVLFNTDMRVSSAAPTNETEAATYENLHFRVKAPVKIFGVYDDVSATWERNAALMHKMLLNAGQICELRMFEEGGHHFEIDNPDCLTDYTNSYGVELEDVPVVYIEMLQFWKRYEQSTY